MKSSTLLATLLVSLVCVSCATQPPTQIVIRGEIANLPDSAKISIMRLDQNMYLPVAECYAIGGKFECAFIPDSVLVLPQQWTIMGDSLASSSKNFMADLGTTNITGEGNQVFRWDISNASTEQKELSGYQKAIAHVEHRQSELFAQCDELYQNFTMDKKQTIDSLQKEAIKLSAEIDLAKYKYFKEVDQISEALLNEFKWMLTSGIKYDSTLKSEHTTLCKIYDKMKGEMKESSDGKAIKNMLYPPKTVKIGDTIPDLELFDVSGNGHLLSEFRGKMVILDFWSSGCGPCIMAGPEIKNMQQKYGDQIEIISISTDTEKQWRDATKAHDVNWTNLSDMKGRDDGFCSNFSFQGIPYFMVINPQGVIIGDWSGYGEGIIEDKINKYLDKK